MISNVEFEYLKKIRVIGNRKKAIKSAINLLKEQDVLIIYQ